MAPDCETNANRPYGGQLGAKVAFMESAGFALSTPMQLGPIIRIPYRRMTFTNSRSRSAPSVPTSRKPAEITIRPLTPFCPHSSAAGITACLGTTMMPRSTGSGTAPMLG